MEKLKLLRELLVTKKNKNKKSDDLSLRLTELKNSLIPYEPDIIVLKDRIIECEG